MATIIPGASRVLAISVIIIPRMVAIAAAVAIAAVVVTAVDIEEVKFEFKILACDILIAFVRSTKLQVVVNCNWLKYISVFKIKIFRLWASASTS